MKFILSGARDMVELSREQYHCVRALFPSQEEYVEPKAVTDLSNPGWVFADSTTQPEAALIWAQGNIGFYFLGTFDPQRAENVNRVIDTIIVPRLAAKKIEYFEFSSVPPVTDTDLENIFKSRKLYSWKQTVYQYKKGKTIPLITPLEGRLCDIKDVGKKYPVENMDFVNKKILNYWDSIDTFHAKANGYCLIIDNIAASLAITGWIAGNTHEISIETLDNYRRRGYAKICASALINCHLQKGYLPHWECESANIASAKLAQGFDFTKLNDYLCYGFKVNE